MLSLFIIIALLTITQYIIIIIWLNNGWNYNNNTPKFSNPIHQKFSIIIPFRNEENNIKHCIASLIKQTYSKNNFEIIFVNDHSTDNSKKMLIPYLNNQIKLYDLEKNKYGKKSAIKSGINYSRYDIIITIDADIIIKEDWLKSINDNFDKTKHYLAAGPVMYNISNNNSFIEKFQQLEFLSLIITTAGAIAQKKPIMCNGANLIFLKSIFIELQTKLNYKFASGDDIFLLYAIKKQYGADKITFINTPASIAYTTPAASWGQFIQQRHRWASKTWGYNNFFPIYIAIIIFFTSFTISIFPILIIFNIKYAIITAILYIIKTIMDFILLKKAISFFGLSISLIKILKFQFLYVFYVSFFGFLSLFQNYTWKNRKTK